MSLSRGTTSLDSLYHASITSITKSEGCSNQNVDAFIYFFGLLLKAYARMIDQNTKSYQFMK